jgi:hypothetical protein
MADEASSRDETGRLTELSERLGEAARRLRDDDLESEEATRLAGECADLASEAAAELDRLVKAEPHSMAPGQEELL